MTGETTTPADWPAWTDQRWDLTPWAKAAGAPGSRWEDAGEDYRYRPTQQEPRAERRAVGR